MSRNPVPDTGIYCVYGTDIAPDQEDEDDIVASCQSMVNYINQSPLTTSNDTNAVTLDELRNASLKDTEYAMLLQATEKGFPTSRGGTEPALRDY